MTPTASNHTPTGRMLASRRHRQGRQHFAAALNWWMGRSGFTHRRMEALSNWTMGEDAKLTSSQVSHLRRINVKEPNYINLDAIFTINRAVWLWQTKGSDAAIEAYGPHRTHGIEASWIDDAAWLAHPDDPTEPLDYGDWAEVVAGYLRLPYLGPVNVSPGEARDLSHELAQLFNAETAGMSMADGMKAVLNAYPVKDPARREKLMGLILDQYDYSQAEVTEELMALAATVARLRGLADEDYGPAQLHTELATRRRRT